MSTNNDEFSTFVDEFINKNNSCDRSVFNKVVPGYPISHKSYMCHLAEYQDFVNKKRKYYNFRANAEYSLYYFISLKGTIYVVSKVKGKGIILGYTTPKEFFGNLVDPKIFETPSCDNVSNNNDDTK